MSACVEFFVIFLRLYCTAEHVSERRQHQSSSAKIEWRHGVLSYRVYLIGGASAQPGDEVVVYTPASLSDTGIALFNLTLPRDHVWSDSISPPAGMA